MRNNAPYLEEETEKFNTYLSRIFAIKIGYFILIILLRISKIYSIPDIIFAVVFLMILISLILAVWFKWFTWKFKTAINLFFLGTALDAILLIIIMYYLGIVNSYIYFTFYIILSFIIFPRLQATILTFWMASLFIFIVALQYLKIIPEYIDITPFPLEQQQTFNNFHYVFASLINYITTICFLAYFSYGFHKMMAKRLIASKQIQGVLEEEKNSLEIRIKARETELELEKKSIEEKVSQRRRDLEKEGEELEKRVKELGKFQKVAVGREIKIASLEKELDRLKKKNGGKQK
jgi:hypothetical protein